ncbi:MAG: hypothetical protein M1833_006812 [Piccolia ochrophora]|nr:MAG: hypothetical protein M1833_006812 [Piccolia ochrophora]
MDQSAASPTDTCPSSNPPRIRRRNRMITSCLECRRRKLKCNRGHPCNNCVKTARDCVFIAPALDSASQLKLTELKEKVGSLERLLEQDVAWGPAAKHPTVKVEEEEEDVSGPEDERDLEPTALAVSDAAFDDDADDDTFDLGLQLGKMRITERIGGFFRPKMSQEIDSAIEDARHDDRTGRGSLSVPTELSTFPPLASLRPGPNHVAPSSGFFFGACNPRASLMDFLPSKSAADRLVDQYFLAVHPLARTVHKPSFELSYESFWTKVTVGIEPAASTQAVFFAAMFSGAVSMSEETILRDFGVGKQNLVDNFRLGAETALLKANFLRSTKVETLQAFVMYLIPQCRDQISRAHSALTGTAIRIAQCMGLHRDGQHYQLTPVETHVRRLIWHQLCFLDLRTCEAHGPQPSIRKDEYDTKLPLNVDDVDLQDQESPPTRSAERWTDVTFSLVRFEFTEIARAIWIDRVRLEKKKISLTAILSKIEAFRKSAEESVLTRGTELLEVSVEFQTDPAFSLWSWYTGAWQQYHAALLLLAEVHVYPNRREADRIWKCCDYIFETDPAHTREQKGRVILTEIRNRMQVFQEMRKMRAPVAMSQQGVPFVAGEQRYASSRSLVQDTLNTNGNLSSSAPLPIEPPPLVPRWGSVSEGGHERSSSSPNITTPTTYNSALVMDDLMADIDWKEWDTLFPPDVNTGELNLPTEPEGPIPVLSRNICERL